MSAGEHARQSAIMTTVIDAHNKWWRIDFREIWEYRNLVSLFAGRSLATMYKQSMLGPVWFIIQPFMMAMVFYVVFGLLINLSTGGMPHMLFYMSGMIFWFLFVNVFQRTSVSLIENARLYGKIYFPRLMLPLSYMVTAAVLFCLNLFVLVLFYLFYRMKGVPIAVGPLVLLTPVLVLQVVVTGLAFGLCIAAATVRFRDVGYLLPTLIQFWMFSTPIFYSSQSVTPRMKRLLWCNPVAAPLECFRYAFSGMNPVGWQAFVPGVLLTLVVLVVGFFWFNKAQRDFIDVV